jgi:hypothetical protein
MENGEQDRGDCEDDLQNSSSERDDMELPEAECDEADVDSQGPMD